jgi:hypothetical protein
VLALLAFPTVNTVKTKDTKMTKAQLWVIKCGQGWWSDDGGRSFFTSPAMARRVADKYSAALNRVGYSIELCGLDDDLAQLGGLYNEDLAKLVSPCLK